MNKWYEENYMNNDIIISSRVSLLRNLDGFPFSLKISEEESEKLIDRVRELLFKDRNLNFYEYDKLSDMTKVHKQALCASYLLSRKYDRRQLPQAVILAKDESDCIRINDKDHLNIISLSKGDQMDRAYEAANQLDDLLNERLPYAYSSKYGYLTTSPMNMGTGMRASYFLHLPFLHSTGLIKSISEELNKFGYVLRSVYGETNDSSGSIFQIYNQRTLGSTEDDLMTSLEKIARQVAGQEKELRDTEIKKKHDAYEDSIYKAYGILKYARSLTAKEAMDYLSNLRVGLNEGILSFGPDHGFDVYVLMHQTRSAVLDDLAGHSQNNDIRNTQRAAYIRERLPELV